MRLAALPAGLRLEAGTSPPVLVPIDGWPGVPGRHEGGGALVHAYLRVHGPATPRDAAAYLQTTRRVVKTGWPQGLVEVRIDGVGARPRRAWLPEDLLDGLLTAPLPDLVRLLPRSGACPGGRRRRGRAGGGRPGSHGRAGALRDVNVRAGPRVSRRGTRPGLRRSGGRRRRRGGRPSPARRGRRGWRGPAPRAGRRAGRRFPPAPGSAP